MKPRPLTGITRDLERLAQAGTLVRLGIIGSVEMGTDLVTQVSLMTGIEIAALATCRPPTAVAAADIAYGPVHDRTRTVESRGGMSAAIGQGNIAITDDPALMATAPEVDVVIYATGMPGVGADVDLLAMEHGKHLVMMNVEADVTIGPYLKREADRLGVVYFLGAG